LAGKGRGKQLELEIGRCNRKYMGNGWAFVVRQEVPVVAIGRKLRRTKAAIPDFMGFVRFRGQSIPVLFDAKETHRRRWPIRSGGGLEEHQIEAMVAFEAMGGIAFVYLAYMADEDRAERRDFLIRIEALLSEDLPKTIPIEIAENIGAETRSGDWLITPFLEIAFSG